MDGSTFVGMVEVTADQFRGSLAVPLMNKPRMGFERDVEADGEFPAGSRTDWHQAGTFTGPVVAFRIVSATGPRFWVHSSLPIRTYAEAMAYLRNSLERATQETIVWDKKVEQWNADRLGMSLDDYRKMMKARRQRAGDREHNKYAARGGLGR